MRTDRLGDEIGADGRMQHNVPMHIVHRVTFVAGGAFCIIAATLSLWRGVWPLNITSPFFAMLIVGACAVGGPVFFAGLTGPSMHWVIEPGRVVITLVNPFGRREVTIHRDQLVATDIREIDSDSGPNSFAVVLKASDGATYQSRDFGTRAVAEGFRDRILERLG